MQRWAILLSGYHYDIVYRSSRDNALADLLSRLPVQHDVHIDEDGNYICHTVIHDLPITSKTIAQSTSKDPLLSRVYEYSALGWPSYVNGKELQPYWVRKDEISIDEDGNYICHTVIHDLPITSKTIAQSTSKDPLLSRVYEYSALGWPSYVNGKELQPYWVHKDEISIDDNSLLWGRRVVIPPDLQRHILLELHDCHPGMCKMKFLARSFVWWSGIDQDIEDIVRFCDVHTRTQGSPKEGSSFTVMALGTRTLAKGTCRFCRS